MYLFNNTQFINTYIACYNGNDIRKNMYYILNCKHNLPGEENTRLENVMNSTEYEFFIFGSSIVRSHY